MQKLSMALAAVSLGLVGAVQAQSSVTLYGVLDTGVGGSKQSYKHSSVGMISGVQSGSRWGLRGQEDLGGGLKANFMLENGFDSATGGRLQGGRMFGRAAWAGVSGGFGEVRFGRQTTAASEVFLFVDPFGGGFGQAGMHSSFNGSSTNRVDNSLFYLSPSWSGLQAFVTYSFNRDGGSAPRRESDQLFSAALKYDRGALALAATYETAWVGKNTAWGQALRALSPQGDIKDPYNVQLGGTWDFGRVQLGAAWSYMKNGYTNPDMGDDFGTTGLAIDYGTLRYFPGSHANAYLLTLSGAVTSSVQAFGSWQMSDPANSMFGGRTSHNQQVYSVGATYTLSARTNFYAFYSYADGAWFDKNWESQNYGVGIRHLF